MNLEALIREQMEVSMWNILKAKHKTDADIAAFVAKYQITKRKHLETLTPDAMKEFLAIIKS